MVVSFYTFRPISKIAKNNYYLRNVGLSVCSSARLSVRLPVLMEQLSSHWTDFHEIFYWSVYRKSVQKIPVSL